MWIDRISAFGGSGPPTKAIDLDHRVAAGHVDELLRHLGRIVRETLDLFRRQRGAERGPRIRRCDDFVLLDLNRLLDGRQFEDDDVTVVPAAELDLLSCPGSKPGNSARIE